METSNMKNIVLLKDLPSNIIEEAIIILKSNININNIEKKRENVKVVAKAKNNSNDYIVKEAEMVVANYISSLEKPKQLEINNIQLKKKYDRTKKLSLILSIISVIAIIINLI